MKGKHTSARMVLIKNNRTRLAMHESFIEEDLAHVQYFMSDMIANDVTFTSIRYPLSDVNSYLQGQVLRPLRPE